MDYKPEYIEPYLDQITMQYVSNLKAENKRLCAEYATLQSENAQLRAERASAVGELKNDKDVTT